MSLTCGCPKRVRLVKFVNGRVKWKIRDCMRPSCDYCRPKLALRESMDAYEAFRARRSIVYRIDGLTRAQATNLAREASREGELALPVPQSADGTTVLFTTRKTRNIPERDRVDWDDLHAELLDAYDKRPVGVGLRIRMSRAMKDILVSLERRVAKLAKAPWRLDDVGLRPTMAHYKMGDRLPTEEDAVEVRAQVGWRVDWIQGTFLRTNSFATV